jgi:hypothetical protein
MTDEHPRQAAFDLSEKMIVRVTPEELPARIAAAKARRAELETKEQDK